MKTNELRIGNYVSVPKFGFRQVISIDPVDDPEIIEYMEPIPITEDWLLKLGFQKRLINGCLNEYSIDCTPNGYKNEYVLRFSYFYKDKSKYDFWFSPVLGGNTHSFNGCKYVHELQNYYYVIIGKELELKQS